MKRLLNYIFGRFINRWTFRKVGRKKRPMNVLGHLKIFCIFLLMFIVGHSVGLGWTFWTIGLLIGQILLLDKLGKR